MLKVRIEHYLNMEQRGIFNYVGEGLGLKKWSLMKLSDYGLDFRIRLSTVTQFLHSVRYHLLLRYDIVGREEGPIWRHFTMPLLNVVLMAGVQ